MNKTASTSVAEVMALAEQMMRDSWDDASYKPARAALESRVRELERDAARYQWVKKCVRTFSLDMGGNHCYAVTGEFMRARGPNLDAAIDSARSASPAAPQPKGSS